MAKERIISSKVLQRFFRIIQKKDLEKYKKFFEIDNKKK